MALEERVCGCELDREVEEARVREGKFFAVITRRNIYEAGLTNFSALLSPLHPNQGNQL